MYGIGNWANPLADVDPGPRCVILPDPRSEDTPIFKCGAPVGDHTVLDYPICDECWSRIHV